MKHSIYCVLLGVASLTAAQASPVWQWVTRPAKASYVIYGGDLSDPTAPAPDDASVALFVRGEAARQMFDAMGPSRKSECGMEKGGRVRQKEQLVCMYRPSDGYQCNLGFDLRSGKSIGATDC